MTDFQNRIIGHGDEPVDEILFNPANWRIHPKQQQDALTGVLEQVGYVQDVIINKTTGNLVDGHLRCQIAAKHGDKTVPCVYVELSPEEEALILATIDPIAAMAATDKAKLEELMHAVQSDNENVQKLMADIAEKEHIAFGGNDIEDAEPQIDKAEELRVKWGVESGQMWQLGDHRIICGDCTDKAVVERVMQGEKGIVFSDPPYGVEIVKNNKVGGGNLCAVGTYAPIVGDETTDTARKFYIACKEYGLTDFILWGGNYFTDFLKPSPCWIIWDKRGDMNSNNFADCEMAWTSFDKPARVYKQIWAGMIREGEHDKRVHPTQKPIETTSKIMQDFVSDIYFDGFSGSGTTIIACEKLGRKCRAVEISPAYVAVAIERWAAATGKTPVLLQN